MRWNCIETGRKGSEKADKEADVYDSFDNMSKAHKSTVGQNNQEYRWVYWATRSSVRSFACTAYSFACSALLALLTRSAALTRSLAHSLRSVRLLPRSWDSEWWDGNLFCVFFLFWTIVKRGRRGIIAYDGVLWRKMAYDCVSWHVAAMNLFKSDSSSISVFR